MLYITILIKWYLRIFKIDTYFLVYGSDHASQKATSFCYPNVYLSIKQLHHSVLLFLKELGKFPFLSLGFQHHYSP